MAEVENLEDVSKEKVNAPKKTGGLKSLNARQAKITQKSKSTGQRETFFGKATEANDLQYQTDSLKDTGPYIAKVLAVFNEEGGGKVQHDSIFQTMSSALASFFGLNGGVSEGVLTVKARLIDAYDTAIPEPQFIGKEASSTASDGGKSIGLIELHDTFTALTVDSNSLSLKPGDLIVVDYRDKKNKRNGYIIGKYYSCETAAEAAVAAGQQVAAVSAFAGGYTSGRPHPTTPAKEGICGWEFAEGPCKGGLEITQTATFVADSLFNSNNTEYVQKLKDTLDFLKTYKYSAITDWSMGGYKSSVSGANTTTWYALNVTYKFTRTGKFNGHPDFHKLLNKMYITLVKACESDFKTSQNIMQIFLPALLTNNGVYVGPSAGIAKRKRNCPRLPENEIFTAKSNDPRCDVQTCAPGLGMHARGEAVDVIITKMDSIRSLIADPKTFGPKMVKSPANHIIGVSMSKANYDEYVAHPVRKWIVDHPDWNLQGEEVVTEGLTTAKLLPLSNEGWHFSTTGW